ncbi:MAG TPA: amidohydrolase family protein [Caulobacteraceae bacterium]|jgi:imidazolonepropionase-like amidohydrolase|nr:amidohydrolase family protein [Caulobacteraceae bacterium]
MISSLKSIALTVCAAAVAAAAPAASAPEAGPPAPVVLYRGATLIDPASGAERPAAAILVRGERIEAVLDAAGYQAPAGARIVETAGLYVLPGLINTHEHLATPPNRPWAQAMMAKDVYGGVTAARDMADDLRQIADLARASQLGEIPGPDLAYAALMAGPEFFDDPRTHEVTRGAVAGQTPWMQAITGQTDLPIAVAMARGTGASAIKIYADLPSELVAAITREAHRQGILVWTHAAVFPASPAQVIGAGVDAVSHVCMLGYQVSPQMPRAYAHRAPVDEAALAGGDNPVMSRLFEEMKRRGIVLDATLRVYAEMDADHAAHPAGPAPYCSASVAEALARQAFAAGVEISAGTDGFSGPEDPWPSLYDELALLQDKVHMSPMQVLRSATLVGAMAMGRQDELGTIAPGRLADLVFTRQDPARDVHALRSLVLTVKRGHDYWRKDYHPGPAPRDD